MLFTDKLKSFIEGAADPNPKLKSLVDGTAELFSSLEPSPPATPPKVILDGMKVHDDSDAFRAGLLRRRVKHLSKNPNSLK